jgi:hypothetical protein
VFEIGYLNGGARNLNILAKDGGTNAMGGTIKIAGSDPTASSADATISTNRDGADSNPRWRCAGGSLADSGRLGRHSDDQSRY